MNGISSSVAVSYSSSKSWGWSVEPRRHDRARAELVLAELLDLDPGRVGGVGDVDHDRRVRAQREGARARAAERDLLLGGRDRGELPLGAAGLWRPAARPPARRTSRGGCPARARRAARRAARPARRRSPRRRRCARSSRACSPSRAPMSMCSSRISATFLRSSSRSRWIGFLPITPLTAPARVSSTTRWPTRICASQPPTSREPQVAVVVDVGDDQADLVDVAHHEQPPRVVLGAVLRRDTSASGVPDHVGAHLRELAGRRAPDRGRGGLIAGRAVRGEQVEQHLRDAPSAGASVGRLACRRGSLMARSARSTYCRMPPWRK